MRFNRKRFSSKLITAVCFVLVLGLTQTAFAKRCWVDGKAYLGEAVPFGKFITTLQSDPWYNTGNVDLYFISADWTLFGAFPTAVSGSPTKGAWRRTGDRSFDWTWLAYVFDESGAVVYILKPTGTMQISFDCKTINITANMSLYGPDQDPLGNEPPAFGCVPNPGPITARLIEVGKVPCDD